MNDPIKHVVVLMLENNSFDRMLGDLQAIYPNLDGVPQNVPPRTNKDANQVYQQAPTTARVVSPDPSHENDHVLKQLEISPPRPWELSDQPKWMKVLGIVVALIEVLLSWVKTIGQKRRRVMAASATVEGNFVLDYAESYPDTTVGQRREIMGYYPLDFLFALHPLAKDFTICDHWFSSVPGPTWVNRFFVHSGTARGIVRMPEAAKDWRNFDFYDQVTIYDRLNERGLPWHVYFGDFPQSAVLMHQWQAENAVRYRLMPFFFEHASGPESAFPAYAFIEPRYMVDPNDDHPDHDIFKGQELMARVFNALRANVDLWNSTLLIITYDEHGGFYDHVPPPEAHIPDIHKREYTFNRLGVRVPALLVSPWVERQVVSTEFDHTSILKYLIEKWDLGPLGERVANANSIGTAIRTRVEPRTDGPICVSIPNYVPQTAPQTVPNGHQQALLEFRKFMEDKGIGPKMLKTARAGQVTVQAQMTEAADWMKAFLESGGRGAS